MSDRKRADGVDLRDISRPARVPRRRVLKLLSAIGVGSTVFRRALAAQVESAGAVTPEMVQQAEWISGISLKAEDRDRAARGFDAGAGGFRETAGRQARQ